MPGTRGGETGVHILNIFYALALEPRFESGFTVLDESGNTVLPSCAAAKYAGKG